MSKLSTITINDLREADRKISKIIKSTDWLDDSPRMMKYRTRKLLQQAKIRVALKLFYAQINRIK